MHRRTLLKMTAAAVALPYLPIRAAAFRRVRPSDPAWPSAAEWQRLGATPVRPLFDNCGECKDLLGALRNPFFLGDQPAGTQTSGWLGAWNSAPSAYVVKANSAKDVAAAVNFAREHNLRLVVKGGGHSYLGTSNAADSLLIWTRDMNQVTVHDGAVSCGAGAMWIDLYDAVTTKAGRYVQGGGCTSVGVAGLVQSGGFGSFSKGFGTAASHLLEAEIVTADGQIRTVNERSDPDLFWALKGGGGGSWGVVTRLTLKTYELPENFGGAGGKIKAKSDAAFRQLLTRFFAFYAEHLFNPHWGEQVAVEPGNVFKISMACQGLSRDETKAVWRPFFDWVGAAPADFEIVDELGAGAHSSRDWWKAADNRGMNRDPRPGTPAHHGWWKDDHDQIGVYLHGYDSLWLPASQLGQESLIDALIAASRYKSVGLHINKGLAGAPEAAIRAARNTATNPAVTEAFALAIIADGEGPAFPGQPRKPVDMDAARKNARLIDLATAELRKIAPRPGSYVSESNYFNQEWAAAYWGENYPKLQAVKAKYDPDGLFFVHHGVGSEGWSADGFERLG
jgi:FAD/FMN-containing dehydrogenase